MKLILRGDNNMFFIQYGISWGDEISVTHVTLRKDVVDFFLICANFQKYLFCLKFQSEEFIPLVPFRDAFFFFPTEW